MIPPSTRETPDFRHAMRHVATPVAIVTSTSRASNLPVGMTVGSFTSVSLDPTMITFFVDISSTTWPKMQDSRTFVVNVLGHEDGALCRAFSRKGDRFADVDWSTSPAGDPVLSDASVVLFCSMYSTSRIGDHIQVVGEVDAAAVQHDTLPLVYFQSDFLAVTPSIKSPAG